MEDMIAIPKSELESLKKRLKEFEEEIDWDLVKQFENSLEDVKQGRIRKVA